MKQLTQEVFLRPDCPPDAKSAAVNSNGQARYWSVPKENLTPVAGEFYSYKCDYSYSYPIDYGYDTTDWQNSAINRE